MRTVADLLVPPNPLFVPRREWTDQQNALLASLDDYFRSPVPSQRHKLRILASAVLPLAQCMVMLGTSPAIAIENAAELLEARYLFAALSETPALAAWFVQ